MSWLYGFFSSSAYHSPLPELRKNPIHQHHGAFLDVYAGGSTTTLFWQSQTENGFLAVLGMPVLLQDSGFRYVSETDWQHLLNNPDSLRSLDGHYAIIHYDGNKLRLYNDPLGKRTIYFRKTQVGYFFCSDLSLLKEQGKTELDYYKFGAVWHSIFPPTQGGYAPLQDSYYKDVSRLGSGAVAVIDFQTQSLQIDNRLFSPQSQTHDPIKLLESWCMLPFQAGKRIGIGLSGGMDIRPLLAIYLAHEVPLTIYNYGTEDNYDFKIAKDIAARFSLPFKHITYAEAEGNWQQVVDFMADRGVVFNPLHSANLGYYPLVAHDCDAYVSGYFGEIFRFRMMAANLKSALSTKPLDYHDIGSYLFRNPPSFFAYDAVRLMHKGFWDNLKTAVNQMPSPYEMLNPLWMHLFVIRYWFSTLQSVNYPFIDTQVLNILPWVQPTLLSQHWNLGFLKQLNEGLHRNIIRHFCPALQEFPLSATDITAPYKTRQLALKLKSWAYYRRHPRLREERTTAFLHKHRAHILSLLEAEETKEDTALDLAKLSKIVQGFYAGDLSQQNGMVCWLAYALGK